MGRIGSISLSGKAWAAFLDGERAYAIGAAQSAGMPAADLAVYKATPDGGGVESRVLFDSGYANNDIVFDAKSPGWFVGMAQTSGPADLEAAGERSLSMALWKFNPSLATVQLSTTYARAGFDFGSGLAVDSDGSLWIAGYSLNPEAPAVGGFDLALWHYAPDVVRAATVFSFRARISLAELQRRGYHAPAAQAPRPRRCIRKDREGAV